MRVYFLDEKYVETLNANSGLSIAVVNNSSYVSAIGKDDDESGIMKIYPTANNGETWFFNLTKPIDGQFDPNEANITKNTDASWHVQPGITRMLAFTKSSGVLTDTIRSNLSTYNYSQLS